MPRISTYNPDPSLSGEDKVIGSSYEGEDVHGPVYVTKNYTLDQLAQFFGSFIDTGEVLVNIQGIEQSVTNNTNAIATANQSITVIANEQLAQSTFQTNLSSTFGTFDNEGNLTSLSQAFADQVLQTTASDRYAQAIFVTNLAASVGTYDANGNLVTMGQAFANQVLSATASDRFATSTFATNLAASFGTYNTDGSIATFSAAAANQILQASTTADFADAQFVTNLVSNFGTFDENGNILTVSASYANDILSTANTAEFAQATAVQNLGASFGTVNSDGSVNFNNTSTYANSLLNYVDSSSALATQISNLETTVTNIPQTIRQPEPPDVNAFPLGSIWIDTDDANAIYILIEGTPRTWSPTTSEALGDLILSNAALQDNFNLLSNDISAEATKLTTLTAQFGVYDPATNTFTINNNASVTSALRTYADSESATAQAVTGLVADVGNNAAAITAEQSARASTDQANATYSFNVASSIGSVDANGNITAVSEAFANSIISTETTGSYATASQIDSLSARVEDTESDITFQQSVTATLEGFAESRYSIQATAGGVVTGMSILSQQGDTQDISQIIFNTGNFKVQNGAGVDQLTINTGTGKAVFAGTLESVDGIFTGTLQAGDVTISNNLIEVDSAAGSLRFTENGVKFGDISAFSGFLSVSADNFVSISSLTGTISTGSGGITIATSGGLLGNIGTAFNLTTGLGVTLNTGSGLTVNQPTNSSFNGLGTGSFSLTGMTSSSITASTTQVIADTQFTVQSGSVIFGVTPSGVTVNGSPISTGGGQTTDTNYYLSGITKSGNTLTFVVTGTTNQSYTFGANAFTSTTIPTNNNQLTNGAGYITSSALNGYVTTTGSYLFSGSLTATDFILSSDINLKENIQDYAVKPINIKYKSYNLIGDDQKRVGVIAQELEVEHPEFVRENKEGIKSVSYIDMLVAKVAELEARIKGLEHGATK